MYYMCGTFCCVRKKRAARVRRYPLSMPNAQCAAHWHCWPQMGVLSQTPAALIYGNLILVS